MKKRRSDDCRYGLLPIYLALGGSMGANFFKQLFLVVVILLTSLAVACSSGNSLQIVTQQLTTRQFTGDTAQSLAAVTGAVKNTQSRTVNDCEVTVVFLDEVGSGIGEASTTRSSLAPGEVWYFNAQLTNPDAWKARTYKITASCH